MKRKNIVLCVLSLSCAMTMKISASAEVSSREGLIPAIMEKGSVLIYDDDFQPIVIAGGYLSLDETKNEEYPCMFSIPSGATEEERTYFEQENKLVEDAFQAWFSDNYIKVQIYPGMKVVYDDISGDINNVYYMDETEPSGYSLHNHYAENNISVPDTDSQTYQHMDGGDLWIGNAEYFNKALTSRDSNLKDKDCVTVKNHFYHKSGENDVVIRNLETGASFVFYQTDVDCETDGIIDVWGIDNLKTLACRKNLEYPVSVRYYQKLLKNK